MSFEELCEAVRQYVESLPTECAHGRDDDWRSLLDETLANLRAVLSNINDDARPA